MHRLAQCRHCCKRLAGLECQKPPVPAPRRQIAEARARLGYRAVVQQPAGPSHDGRVWIHPLAVDLLHDRRVIVGKERHECVGGLRVECGDEAVRDEVWKSLVRVRHLDLL